MPDLFYLEGSNSLSTHSKSWACANRNPLICVQWDLGSLYVLLRAPQCRLIPAVVSFSSTYQTCNLRLSKTDPSSKSIMQCTESIFHLVFHGWGETSFLDLQSGVFLPFCFVWVWFWVCFFPLLSQTINVSHWLALQLLCWFDRLCKAKMKSVPCGSVWRPLLIQLILN